MDSSNVYGSTETEAEDVRDKEDRALLAVTSSRGFEGRDLLPTCRMAVADNREPESCDLNNCGAGCTFVGGDFRVNEMPALTVQHTVWVREHNRIATQLKRINPTWRAERVFQETRRIVNAEWQNIIFSEWLPILLGRNYVQEFGLTPLKSGYSSDYNPATDPSISNEFAAAAFRFGHTLLTPNIPGRDENGRNTTFLELRDAFNTGVFLQEKGFIEDTVRGQSQEPVPAFDGNFAEGLSLFRRFNKNIDFEDVMNHLFETEEGNNGGLDLLALNIQRGREHGIPGYRCVGLSVLTKFNKSKKIFSGATQRCATLLHSHRSTREVFVKFSRTTKTLTSSPEEALRIPTWMVWSVKRSCASSESSSCG